VEASIILREVFYDRDYTEWSFSNRVEIVAELAGRVRESADSSKRAK
jgi:hypothetical protein